MAATTKSQVKRSQAQRLAQAALVYMTSSGGCQCFSTAAGRAGEEAGLTQHQLASKSEHPVAAPVQHGKQDGKSHVGATYQCLACLGSFGDETEMTKEMEQEKMSRATCSCQSAGSEGGWGRWKGQVSRSDDHS